MTIENALIKTLGFGVQDFLKKAVEGGWKAQHAPSAYEFSPQREVMLLDPTSWRAVANVEGWPEYGGIADEVIPGHIEKQHRFIDALNEEV